MANGESMTGSDLDYLRKESLWMVLFCMTVVLYLWCIILFQPINLQPVDRVGAVAWAPALLAGGLAIAFAVQRRSLSLAAAAAIAGMAAAILSNMWVTHANVAPYMLAVVVSLTGLLFGMRTVIEVTVLCSISVVAVGSLHWGDSPFAAQLLSPVLVIGAVGALSSLAVRNLYLALYWALDHAMAAQRSQEELRDRHFKMVLIPRLEGGQSANYVKPSMFWSITSQSKHPEEAAMFIDFFTNSGAANEILLAERGVPVSSVVKENLKPLLEPAAVETFDFLALVEENSIPVPPPDPVGWADVRNNIYYPEFVDPVLYGLISPEEGAATFRELANETLAASQ
jgi:hypothetical protein